MTTRPTWLAKRAELIVGTLNRGDHARFDAIEKACARADLIALQEMHDQRAMLRQLAHAGFGVWAGDREDSWANPVVWNPEVFRAKRFDSYPLLPAGRRAGKHNMAKTLNVVRGIHLPSGRRIAFGSAHNIQTQFRPGRRQAARTFVEALDEHAERFACATFIGGDWNARPDGHSLRPLWQRPIPWQYDQRRLNQLPTHGRRAIDGVIWQDRAHGKPIVNLVDHFTREVPGTDHRALYAHFSIRIKEKR